MGWTIRWVQTFIRFVQWDFLWEWMAFAGIQSTADPV
ncbi:hypothetical protein PMI27_000160 [Pseudomonas sp. GM41(2012)]|jgi:hypothetical protein|nr:hypothetical protein PMI27_000160 [Pseudomonas sp. GM41(2012)]